MPENISPHISYAEATVSATGKRLGIKNVPPPETLDVMKITAKMVFEPIRERFGVPIQIISFYRSWALNRLVGGAKKSQHPTGEAIDIQMTSGVKNADVWYWLKECDLPFCQCIWEFGTDEEPDWIHISYATVTRSNDRQFLRAKKVKQKNGKYKTVYEPY